MDKAEKKRLASERKTAEKAAKAAAKEAKKVSDFIPPPHHTLHKYRNIDEENTSIFLKR